MDKKKIIISCFIILFIIIAIILLKTKSTSQLENQVILPEIQSQIKHSEEYGVYYVTAEGSDVILYVTDDANDPDLQFYLDHPDYNPNPLKKRTTSLEDFVNNRDELEE